jgi:hypothetical protein
MVKEGELIGTFNLFRQEVRQIGLHSAFRKPLSKFLPLVR